MQNIDVKPISEKEKAKIKRVTDIHMKTFEGFFLTFMGKGFLNIMYKAYVKHDLSNLVCATDERGNVLGFMAYSKDVSALYKYMIKHSLIAFAWYSLGAFLRKPKVFMRLIRAFLKPSQTKREEKYINLSSIGVSPEAKNKGVGSKLIDWLKQEEQFSGCEYISLETDAKDNESANSFYVKNKFSLERIYATKENRLMNEYRYYLGKE